ncbi:unnamed protein product [Gongylonema pulchrum]|uniref:Uncharacterized protein n=1 Tax=Gongylonema pulchrum TaxID=637853 RepID=A0A183DYK3_9BILA|nr:unnamed protein product [Gongylonema pulchrum]
MHAPKSATTPTVERTLKTRQKPQRLQAKSSNEGTDGTSETSSSLPRPTAAATATADTTDCVDEARLVLQIEKLLSQESAVGKCAALATQHAISSNGCKVETRRADVLNEIKRRVDETLTNILKLLEAEYWPWCPDEYKVYCSHYTH